MSVPRIAILMAVYEPDMAWLAEQLDSLNAQTYPDLFLYVCDDCSPNAPYEQLTAQAQGAYFAYCDQDDVSSQRCAVISTPTDLPNFERLLVDGSDFGLHLSYKVQPSPDGLAQAFFLGGKFLGDEAEFAYKCDALTRAATSAGMTSPARSSVRWDTP